MHALPPWSLSFLRDKNSIDGTKMELWYTLGPTSLGKERELLLNGATGVRLTFGFGTAALQYERALYMKKISSEVCRQCLIIADLNGEKYRLGKFESSPTISVTAGSDVHLIAA